MKNKFFLVLAVVISVFLSSCYQPYYYEYVDACFYTQEDTYFVNEEIQFYNCSDQAQSYFWDFGDGETSTLINPKHTYIETGEYEVKLNAYGRDGKESAYTVLTIVEDFTPTKLNILVQYFGTTDELADCPVDLYLTQEDWANFQNPILSDNTDDDGIVEFTDLDPQIYYIDAFKSVSDSGYYSNENLGVATDTLIAGTTNYYDVFVQYLVTASGKKIYKVKQIVKSSSAIREEYLTIER
jgi:PKD repeat protein